MKVKIIIPTENSNISVDDIITFISLDYNNSLLKFHDGFMPDFVCEYDFRFIENHAYILSRKTFSDYPKDDDYLEVVFLAKDYETGKKLAHILCDGSLKDKYSKQWCTSSFGLVDYWFPDTTVTDGKKEFVSWCQHEYKWNSKIPELVEFMYIDIPQSDTPGKHPDRTTYYDASIGEFFPAEHFRTVLPNHKP